MRLLIVDDHQEFVWTVRETFLNEHDVETAHTLASARDHLVSQQFDLVLLDFDLPDGKGTELIPALRQTPRPTVIAISSHRQGNTALLDAGANAACAKADFATIRGVLARLATQSHG